MTDPYRKPAERPPVQPEHRRYYTKSGDVEKGPFDAKTLTGSVREGYIKKSTLIRAEDEREWRRLSDVFAIEPIVVRTSRKSREKQFFYKIGVDGTERGPVPIERVSLLKRSEKRSTFIRSEDDETWTPYTRYMNRQRTSDAHTKERFEMSDVTRNALGRFVGGLFLASLGIGLSVYTSRIFVGLVVWGLVLMGRGVYRWGDGRA